MASAQQHFLSTIVLSLGFKAVKMLLKYSLLLEENIVKMKQATGLSLI